MPRSSTKAARPDAKEQPPTRLLAVAAASVVIGAVLVVLGEFALHVVGYVLASFQTIGLVAAYTRIDNSRRSSAHYVPLAHAGRIVSAITIAGIMVAGVHVWMIATELAG
ncbi:MAG TPA: hypothetical protein VFZ83_02635 [Acidimicrobiia bacterium]|nr:hypothetical protein [Acidimicrobiia bacterium]